MHRTELVLAAAFLAGMDHAQGHRLELADDEGYRPLPFEEAIQFLKARVSLTKAEWEDLEPKLAFRAFTLARLTSCDYIEAIRGRLINTLEKGEGFEQAWADVKAIAESEGATINPGYWETVYRTNIQTAYNAGRRMQFDRSKPAAYALMVLEDERTSSICRPLTGLVLPANHPFWDDHWPPFHFNCRTTVRGIYEEEVAEVPVQNLSMAKLRKTFKPQEGFGQNPIAVDSFWMLTKRMVERAKQYGIENSFYNFYRMLFPLQERRERGIHFNSVPYKPIRDKLVKAFSNAPEKIKALVEQVQNKVQVVPSLNYRDDRIVYFFAGDAIFIDIGASYARIRHELGHAIDNLITINSASSRFVLSFNNDRDLYLRQDGNLTARGEEVVREEKWKDNPPLSDTFAALTKNKILGNWGHPIDYWNRDVRYQYYEVVADAYELYGMGDTSLIAYYRVLFPTLSKYFDSFFEMH